MTTSFITLKPEHIGEVLVIKIFTKGPVEGNVMPETLVKHVGTLESYIYNSHDRSILFKLQGVKPVLVPLEEYMLRVSRRIDIASR
jgi:hypothetical protein